MKKLKLIDLFTGIAGFSFAAESTGRIETIMTSEIDGYNCKLIEQNLGLDNAGSVTDFAVNFSEHPQNPIFNSEFDLVPAVELTGFSTVSYEDFFDGAMDFPDIISGGFPCQQVTSANLHGAMGIDGKDSSLVTSQLDIIENLEPDYVVFENAELLRKRGLDRILLRLSDLGYIVEWETISASAFLSPQYRHRVYIVGYLPTTKTAMHGRRVFDCVRQRALKNLEHCFRIPLLSEDPDWVQDNAVLEDTKSIPLRTKRINGLGNSIVPDIAKAIFEAIIAHDDLPCLVTVDSRNQESLAGPALSIVDGVWFDNETGSATTDLPSRGLMQDSVIVDVKKCELLNVSKRQYAGLYPSLLRKDGNNNFSCASRATRPGGLGGLVGHIMTMGIEDGGLHPLFCERLMGYPDDYTLLVEPRPVIESPSVGNADHQLSMGF